jgi:anaerobic magnesium-protoporphyrin IX monomethyl ester cyclase
MRILLIDSSQINNKTSSPHLGLAYIASQIKEFSKSITADGFYVNNTTIKNYEDFQRAEAQFVDRIANSAEKYDIIMLSTTYATMRRAIKIATAIKKSNPQVKVIAGGPQISFILQWDMEYINKNCQMFDIFVEGEGEKVVFDLVDHIKHNKDLNLPGLTIKKNGTFKRISPTGCIKDLDAIKAPSWDLFDLEQYASYLRVLASRGCPFNCSFCDTKKQWPGYRYRTAVNVFNELKSNAEDYGINTFRFVDPTFTAYPNLITLCKLIAEKKLEISFVAYAHIHTVTSEKLEWLKKAGCSALYYGIESGSNLVLDGINKNTTISRVKDAIELTRANGIKTAGSFILGLPSDNYDTMMQTIAFAKELNCDIYSWHSYMPSLVDIVKDDNVKDLFDWKTLNLDFPKEIIDDILETSQYEYLLDRHMITRYCQYGSKPISSYPKNYQNAPHLIDVVKAMKIALNETTLSKSNTIDAVESLESFLESKKKETVHA